MNESKAKHRNWEQKASITGDSPEHKRIRELLDRLGPAALLLRLRAGDGAKSGAKAVAEELQLNMLTFEVGALPQPPSAGEQKDRNAKLRYFMTVKDKQSGEACLYWEEPKPLRTTDPSQNQSHDDFTRKLHDSVAPSPAPTKPALAAAAAPAAPGSGKTVIVNGSSNQSSAASTPRGGVRR